MFKPKTEMAFGQPVWDIHACDICGALVLPSTAKLHSDYHGDVIPTVQKTQHLDLICEICELVLSLPLDYDGAMILDDYDDHIDSHEIDTKLDFKTSYDTLNV